MQLSPAQIERVVQWLNRFWTAPRTCSVCRNVNWNINDKVLEMREFQGGGLILGGNSIIMPLIAVTCTNCGNTLHFSAIQMGAINRPEVHQDNPAQPLGMNNG